MNILQLRTDFEDSGPGSQALTIGRELRRRGHNVVYASCGGVMVDKIKAEGFEYHSIPWMHRDRRGLVGLVKTVFALRSIIKRGAIDVVHGHNAASTYCAWLGSLGLGDVRVCHSVRGIELRKGYGWRNWIYKMYPAKMMAVCEFTRKELISLGANPKNILVTYNGADLTKFDPGMVSGDLIRKEFGLGGAIVLGHVGAFSGWKGQEVLVRALSILVGKGHDLKVIFVGDGPSREMVERLSVELAVRDRVIFAGMRFDVQYFHACFNVYCQPSTQGEMFPNAIVEAMAMGKPWVGSDISGLSELTAGGKAGRVVPPGDPVALATAIEEIVSNREVMERMGASARTEVLDKFTIEKVVNRILQVYGRS